VVADGIPESNTAESALFGRAVAAAGAFLGSRAFPARLLSTFFPTPFVGFPFVLKRAAPVTNHRTRRILSAIVTVMAEHAVTCFNFRAGGGIEGPSPNPGVLSDHFRQLLGPIVTTRPLTRRCGIQLRRERARDRAGRVFARVRDRGGLHCIVRNAGVCGRRRSFSDGTHSIRPHGASDPPRARWTLPQTTSRGRFCSVAASSACEPRLTLGMSIREGGRESALRLASLAQDTIRVGCDEELGLP